MTNKIEIVTYDEAEGADYYVCIPLTNPLALPGNMIDACCKCGQAIQHRPNYPMTPKKICTSCIDPLAHDMMITQETANEVADYLHKKNAH
jgi:hypothetical protein